MHRVELKDLISPSGRKSFMSFLMHRVELKAEKDIDMYDVVSRVPNAPCGVESLLIVFNFHISISKVPNAPCGVESLVFPREVTGVYTVPNAPCGVERCEFFFPRL